MTFVEEFILSGGILVIAALTIANVFCRTFFGFSLAFAEEVSQFLIVLIQKVRVLIIRKIKIGDMIRMAIL